jgi:hypothetical protein
VRNDRILYYYDRKNMRSKEYGGVISLAEIAAAELAQHRGHSPFSFDIVTHRKRTHRFSCSNEQDLVDWLTVLEALIWGEVEQIALRRRPRPMAVQSTTPILKPRRSGNGDGDGKEDDDEEEDEEERARPTTPTIRGSVSAFASKFKQLTASSRGTSPRHSGPFVATMTHSD